MAAQAHGTSAAARSGSARASAGSRVLRLAVLRLAVLRLARWLPLAAAAVAVWPVTVVTGLGYAAAWRRGWSPARLGRAAAWALPMTAVWAAAESARGWRAIALNPVRDGGSGWPHLSALTVVRTFLLVAPVTIPAGLALAALLLAAARAKQPAAREPAAGEAPRREPAAGEAARREPAARPPLAVPAPRRGVTAAAEEATAAAEPASRDRQHILSPGAAR